MYFNTTEREGQQLIDAMKQTNKQDEAVILLFKNRPRMTASETWQIYCLLKGTQTPLTSIRRSLSTLKEMGQLIKTQMFKTGMFGKPEHVYEITDKQLSLFTNI